MEKIIDYVILEDSAKSQLAKTVLSYVAKGWQPLGGVTGAYTGSAVRYAQAMALYAK